jgi:DNA-binding NarL/FixJ family response regulator
MAEAVTEKALMAMELPEVNVLINLSSRLLCEALRDLLQNYKENYRIFIPHDSESPSPHRFDKILVDAATLDQPHPDWQDAKLILVDSSLPEEEITRLLCTHKLSGVISTDTGTDLFLKALETIRGGQIWIDNVKLKALIQNSPSAPTATGHDSLSKKEREIVLLIAEGFRNKEIASHLRMSEHTVKTHISRILKKANVSTRAQLVPLAIKFK